MTVYGYHLIGNEKTGLVSKTWVFDNPHVRDKAVTRFMVHNEHCVTEDDIETFDVHVNTQDELDNFINELK